jgi:hypothetical protein
LDIIIKEVENLQKNYELTKEIQETFKNLLSIGSTLKEKINDFAWAYIDPFWGYIFFEQCFIDMLRLKEASYTYTSFADFFYIIPEERYYCYGLASLLSEYYDEAIDYFEKGINYFEEKKEEIINKSSFEKYTNNLDLMLFNYNWAFGMDKYLKGDINNSLIAFHNSKLIKNDIEYIKLMEYLINQLNSNQKLLKMSSQLFLLKKFQDELKNEKISFSNTFDKKDKFTIDMMGIMLIKTENIQQNIFALKKEFLPYLKIFKKMTKNPILDISNETYKNKSKMKEELAQMWTNDSKKEGIILSLNEYEGLIEKIGDYDIFIIDEGNYNSNSIGKVYINSNQMKTDYLSQPLLYRILVYTLKQGGSPGEIYNLINNCWFDKDNEDIIQELKETRNKEKMGEPVKRSYDDLAKKYFKAISLLNTKLLSKLNIKLTSKRSTLFELHPFIPRFCIIEKKEIKK